MDTTFATVAEAAQIAGVTDGAVRSWIAAGHLTAYRRVGNKRLFVQRDDLARFLEPVAVTS